MNDPTPQTRKATGDAAERETLVTTPVPRAAWRELLTTDPEAMPGATPEWIDCVCGTGRYLDASRMYQLDSGQRMVLPMVRRTGPVKIAGLEASLPPAWGIAGLLAERPPSVADVAAVIDDLAARPALRIAVRPNPRRGQLWAAACPPGITVVPRRAHVLDLDGGFDQVWTTRFPSRTRGKIRKAERAGVSVECDMTGRFVPDFYDLYQQSVTRWATRQKEPRALAYWRATRRDPIERLRHMAGTMGRQCQIWLARLDGEPIAGMIVLRGGNNAHYTRGAMNAELAGPSQANYLLFSRAIEDACRGGAAQFHMGESGTSSSLSFFKERFGAVAHEYAEYRFERLPITRMDGLLRQVVKRAVGFEEAS